MRTVLVGVKALVLLLILFTSQISLANHERKLDMNWISALQLTTAQQEQMQQAEQKYRQAMRALSHKHCNETELNSQKELLQQQLHTDLRAILSEKQKQRASQMMHDRHKGMQLQQTGEIIRSLQLSDEQSQALILAVNQLELNYQWPLDLAQRDMAKAEFERTLQQHLTPEQWKKWQVNLDRHQGRWHSSKEFDKKCPPAEHDEHI